MKGLRFIPRYMYAECILKLGAQTYHFLYTRTACLLGDNSLFCFHPDLCPWKTRQSQRSNLQCREPVRGKSRRGGGGGTDGVTVSSPELPVPLGQRDLGMRKGGSGDRWFGKMARSLNYDFHLFIAGFLPGNITSWSLPKTVRKQHLHTFRKFKTGLQEEFSIIPP